MNCIDPCMYMPVCIMCLGLGGAAWLAFSEHMYFGDHLKYPQSCGTNRDSLGNHL